MEQSINLELFLSEELKMTCQSLLSFMLFFVMKIVFITLSSEYYWHYHSYALQDQPHFTIILPERKTSRFPFIFSKSILQLICCVKISHLLKIKRSTIKL